MDNRYILVGPALKAGDRSIGGTTVSFELVSAFFRKHAHRVELIHTNVFQKGLGDFINSLLVIARLIWALPKADIIFLHASPKGILVLGTVAGSLCRLFRKKMVLRVFGGDLDDFVERSNVLNRFIWNHFALHADLICLQTRNLVDYFQRRGKQVYWLPTSRSFPKLSELNKVYSRRFVYISQIFSEKGIDYIMKLKENLPEGYTLDIYGPILDARYSFLKNEKYYHGSLSPDKVFGTLQQYDFLILPSMHRGEGYPGIIIESFGVGVPVIAFDWRSIGELIRNGENGILLPPGDYESLFKCVLSLNQEIYFALRRQALQSSAEYESEIVNRNLFHKLESL